MVDLKAFRKANHLTQIELADFFGVGQGFISQIEKGDRPIPSEYISKLFANPHNWNTSMLMDLDQPENPVKEEPGTNGPLIEYLKRKVAELEGKVEKLTDEKADLLQQNAVLKYENQLLAPQKGRNAEDAESFLSASAAQ